MPQEIRICPQALGGIEQQLLGGIDDYCGFKLESLSASLPVSASADHDGRLAGIMESALSAFRTVIAQDDASIREMGEVFSASDRAIASKLGAGRG